MKPSSEDVARRKDAIDELTPYLSGFESYSGVGRSVMSESPPQAISQTIEINQWVEDADLEDMGMTWTLTSAFTPVAALTRSVFGYPNLVDRLDAMLRAVEISLAFFSLAMMLERKAVTGVHAQPDAARLEKAMFKAFNPPPTFASWKSLLLAFSKRPQSGLALRVYQTVNLPAVYGIAKLRESLAAEAGEVAVSNLKKEIDTLGDTLDLLQAIRNVTTAHGRADDLKDSFLYTGTLLVTLHMLAQLPWDAARIAHLCGDSDVIRFFGCLPEAEPGFEVDGLAPGTYAVIGDSEPGDEQWVINAEEFFRVDERQPSIAMYVGEAGFFDPLAGARVERDED